MKWVDIASPSLRKVYQSWVSKRGTRLMTHIREYNGFLVFAPENTSVSVRMSKDSGIPTIRHVGSAVTARFPEMVSGKSFADLVSVTTRVLILQPYFDVAKNRQPECQRGTARLPGQQLNYEQLLLPFDNDQLQVGIVHAVYEFGIARERA